MINSIIYAININGLGITLGVANAAKHVTKINKHDSAVSIHTKKHLFCGGTQGRMQEGVGCGMCPT